MNEGARGGDEMLVDLLREAVAAHDAVPDQVVEAARGAWTWRTIDAELAELAHDSLLDDAALAGVRGAATVRALSFVAGTHLVEVEISEDGDRRRIVGQLMPPPAPDQRTLHVERVGAAAVAVEVDDLGRFEADRLAPGLLRLRTAGAGSIVTEWVAI